MSSRPYLDQAPPAPPSETRLRRARTVNGTWASFELEPGALIFTVGQVVAEVASAFGVEREQLTAGGRHRTTRHVYEARCGACWLLRRHTRMTAQQLSLALGYGEHTAAVRAYRVGEELRERDEWFRDVTDRIERMLEARAAAA